MITILSYSRVGHGMNHMKRTLYHKKSKLFIPNIPIYVADLPFWPIPKRITSFCV